MNAEPEEDTQVRRLSKIDEKRIRQYQERRRRLINKGVPAEKVDQAIAEEDYRSMPVEKKFERLEALVANSVKRMSSDMLALRHNDGVLADSMDSNFKAMARCLEKAGVSLADQSAIISAVNAEIAAEREQKMAAKMQAEAEKAAADALKDAETQKASEEEEVAIPEEATTFGG